jgi:predicted transcriptional regulator
VGMGDPTKASTKISSERPFLSPGEWWIFSILARRGPLTVRKILGELAPAGTDDPPSYTTISTLTLRVAAKGYLSEGPKAAPRGPASAVVFSACVPYEEALRLHTERFLAQYALGGPEDLLQIRQVIDQNLSD